MARRLSPQLFALLRPFLEQKVGIHYSATDIELFSEKVYDRMQEAGFESPLDYYYRLRYDDPTGDELAALVETFVVGETYLFRELDPLLAAIGHVVKPAIARKGRARIWSAACSSGEEPVSLAILLADQGILDRCSIRATDVSSRALARALEAHYGTRALRAVESAAAGSVTSRVAERWLVRSDRTARPRPEILERIEFRQHNLLDRPPATDLASFDLVLCRNVLIYFADETIQRVIANLSATLEPCGRLLVGAAESLMRFGTELKCEERSGAFFYAKETK